MKMYLLGGVGRVSHFEMARETLLRDGDREEKLTASIPYALLLMSCRNAIDPCCCVAGEIGVSLVVIPAQAGTYSSVARSSDNIWQATYVEEWVPACTGMTIMVRL